MVRPIRRRLALGLLTLGVSLAGVASSALADSWPSGSQGINGNHNQATETTIGTSNVAQLAQKWVFTDHGDVSATPTVADGTVYFPDFGGYLNAVDAQTGGLVWQTQISTYDGQTGQVSRNSPLIDGNALILGDNASAAQSAGAHLFAVSRTDGHLLWSTEIDNNPAAIVTSDPVAYGNEIVVGVASNEEADAEAASYPCCTFRGAVVAVNATTGKLLWKTYTVPSNNPAGGDSNIKCSSDNPAAGCGYSGGAVWATPTIDPSTNRVFVGTGNNYTTPDAATACANADQSANPPVDDSNCTVATDYFDSVLALNLQTGKLIWGHKVQGYDAWNVACAIGNAPGATWCPSPASPDFDFGGSSPNLLTVTGADGETRTFVGDGQKSGVYWVFDPSNGKLAWDTLVGPGSSLGGMEWGSAYDGRRIYVAEADPFGASYKLADGTPAYAGSWAALNPATGAIEWQTATPNNQGAIGAVSEANGVTYAASMDPSATNPDMFALDSTSGKILWSFAAGSSVNAGPAIANGTVYWGSGYGHLGPFLPFTGNDKFYAFSLNGH